jgi:hypothetical protein
MISPMFTQGGIWECIREKMPVSTEIRRERDSATMAERS